MVPRQSVGLWVLLLALVSAHPAQQPPPADQQSSEASQQQQLSQPEVSRQPSAAEQLSALVEGAVSRAQSGWQLAQLAGRLERLQAGADAGQRALVELTRQQLRLDAVARDVSALQLAALVTDRTCIRPLPGASHSQPARDREAVPSSAPEPEPTPGPVPVTQSVSSVTPKPGAGQSEMQSRMTHSAAREPAPEIICEARPKRLPAGVSVYQEPAVRACSRSCLQLRDSFSPGVPQDGVYWLTGLPVPVLCDFSHDGGGWTLLLTAVSKDGWDPLSVLARDELSPTLTDNYSILKHADAIRDLGTGDRFAYRIETQAEKGRQRWGGIWFAPKHYSFVDETGSQTEVGLMRRFDQWVYKNEGVKRRMPWINTRGYHYMHPILTTTGPSDNNFWGTMVTHVSYAPHHHSAWHNPDVIDSGTVLYWMKENAL